MSDKYNLKECIHKKLEKCMNNLDNNNCTNLHKLLLEDVEEILFQFILQKTNNNKSKASKILGINRATFNKKAKHYNLI